jgi:ribosomal protein S6--L-glutamate ligase
VSGLRIAILGEPAGWHASRIAAVLGARGHAAAIVPWSRLTASLRARGETIGPAVVSDADLILVRGMPGGGLPEDRLEQVIFRMNALGRIASRGMPVINSPRSLEVAIDKHLSLCHLFAAGIAVPPTMVVQDPVSARDAWQALGGDCLLKPLFGSRGRGIVRVTTPDELTSAIMAAGHDHSGGIFYMQRWIDHPGWDARILVVGQRTFCMRRMAAEGEWRANLSCGGKAEPFAPPEEWLDVARRAAAAIGTEVAGVDLLPTRDGGVTVLEVNGVPGWRGLEGATGCDVTGAVADLLEAKVRTGP